LTLKIKFWQVSLNKMRRKYCTKFNPNLKLLNWDLLKSKFLNRKAKQSGLRISFFLICWGKIRHVSECFTKLYFSGKNSRKSESPKNHTFFFHYNILSIILLNETRTYAFFIFPNVLNLPHFPVIAHLNLFILI
jgi:hypothetical protein